MENKGFYNWLAQKLFKRPRFSYIDLDEFGSFVWKQMDGKRTIYGDRAEPVVERLVKYFQILYRNHFIGYVTEKK